MRHLIDIIFYGVWMAIVLMLLSLLLVKTGLHVAELFEGSNLSALASNL